MSDMTGTTAVTGGSAGVAGAVGSAGAGPDLEALLDSARGAQRRAYAPYSGFRVGCALLAADGRVFLGANVENAAYSPTICAERVALPAAVVAGVRDFVALAVVGDGSGPCTPCGVCRQVLFEFAPDLVVVAAGSDGGSTRYVLGRDLLPDGFGPRRLAAGDGARAGGDDAAAEDGAAGEVGAAADDGAAGEVGAAGDG